MSFQATLELSETQQLKLWEVVFSKEFRIYYNNKNLLVNKTESVLTITFILERELRKFLHSFFNKDKSIDDNLLVLVEGEFGLDFCSLFTGAPMPKKKSIQPTVLKLRHWSFSFDWNE